jgi:hypothetical protein
MSLENGISFGFDGSVGATEDGEGISFDANNGGATSGAGGSLALTAGSAQGGNSNGGNIDIVAGTKTGSGTDGYVYVQDGAGNNIYTDNAEMDFAHSSKLYNFFSGGIKAIIDTASVTTTDKTFTFPNLTGTFVLTTSFIDNETVSGSGTSFTLANTPVAGSVHLYGLGQRLKDGGNDYSISGTAITTINTYSTGDLIADYRI